MANDIEMLLATGVAIERKQAVGVANDIEMLLAAGLAIEMKQGWHTGIASKLEHGLPIPASPSPLLHCTAIRLK